MICPTGKSAKSCLSPVAKINRFAFDPKHLYERVVSCPHRGAYHGRHETLARDAVDAGGIEDERYRCGRQSRVVLAPDAGVKFAGKNPQATVANKPDHRGERGISRKPLCRGCPGASAEPVCSCAPLLPLRMRPRVQRAPGIPCALWLWRDNDMTKLGCIRVARMRSHISPSSFRGAPLGANPESINHDHCGPMDFGFALRAPRNDDGERPAVPE